MYRILNDCVSGGKKNHQHSKSCSCVRRRDSFDDREKKNITVSQFHSVTARKYVILKCLGKKNKQLYPPSTIIQYFIGETY